MLRFRPQNCADMTKNRLIYLLALIGTAVFYCCYREWMGWLLLLMVVGILPLSLVLSLPGAVRLRLRVNCPAAVPLGTAGAAGLTVSGTPLAPPVKGKFRVTRALSGEQWLLKDGAPLPTDHCGQLKVEPVKLRLYDYLGIVRLPIRKPANSFVLVRPAPVPVKNPPGLGNYLALSWKPKPGGGFAENHELRPYRPGDNLNQIHWKLTAKTGRLMVREAMEPIRGKALLTMDLSGTPEELDRKLGRLLWMSRYLLARNMPHEIRCLTGDGIRVYSVTEEETLDRAIDGLLCCPRAVDGTIEEHKYHVFWQYHVGGDAHEEH